MNPKTGLDPSTYARYGPWACPTCGEDSHEMHRCTSCGKIIEGAKSTAGREEQ